MRVTAAAMQAFDQYNSQMLRLYGQHYPHQKYQDNTRQWKACMEIGKLCVDEEWDVVTFITETMRLMRHNRTLMHPRKLLHPNVVGLFRRDNAQGVILSSPQNTWAYLVQDLKETVKDTGATVEGLLFSPLMSYPEWFRVVYPEQVEERTYEFYGAAARQQLAEHKALRAFIRKAVPGRLEALERRWGYFKDGKEE